MHFLAKLIVEGDNEQDAVYQAQSDAETLVEWGEYDWYDMNGRWGDSKAHKVSSVEGKQLVKKGLEAEREEFDSALRHIRYMLKHYSDDEIFEEDFGNVSYEDLPEKIYTLGRHKFGNVYDAIGPFLYAVDGELWGGRIRNNKELKMVLKRKSSDKPLWVVPVDFHN